MFKLNRTTHTRVWSPVCLKHSRAQFALVKSSFTLYDSAPFARHDVVPFIGLQYRLPVTFAEILTTVTRQQEAWEIVELEIRNNLMDENLSWIPDCIDTFCQELQDSALYISSNTGPPTAAAPAASAD